MQITVNYTDTSSYKVTIEYDQGTESPSEWGNFEVKVFGCRDINNATRDDFYNYDANGKLNIGMVSRLRHGTAFPINIRNYSSAGDYYYDMTDDAESCDGFILLDTAYVKGVSFEERKRYATGDLETYQQWANGDVYYVSIEDALGNDVDSCGGLYGSEAVKQMLNEAIPGYQLENLTLKGDASDYML